MKPTRRPSVSLVTETGMFLSMASPFISAGPLLSLRSSARDGHCLRLLVCLVCVGVCVRVCCLSDHFRQIIFDHFRQEIISDLLSDHFLDFHQSRESVCLPFTCHPSHLLATFVFRSSEVRRHLLDMHTYGDTDPYWACFLFFLRELVMIWPHIMPGSN